MHVNSRMAFNIGVKRARYVMCSLERHPDEALLLQEAKRVLLDKSNRSQNVLSHMIEAYVTGYKDTVTKAEKKHHKKNLTYPEIFSIPINKASPVVNRPVETMTHTNRVTLIMEGSTMPVPISKTDIYTQYAERIHGSCGLSKDHLDQILRKLSPEELVLFMYTLSQAVATKGVSVLSIIK